MEKAVSLKRFKHKQDNKRNYEDINRMCWDWWGV